MRSLHRNKRESIELWLRGKSQVFAEENLVDAFPAGHGMKKALVHANIFQKA